MKIYNGWITLNKTLGESSNHAVQKVKRLTGKNNKVGHAGTLDPLAHGVLPIAIGEATKTTKYLMDASKEYEFDLTWGEERSTGDSEGEITASGGRIPNASEIEKAIANFIGKIMQMPPIYSALKVNGNPAYKLAREGKEVALSPREILIESLNLITHDEKQGVSKFKVTCGKGTYVRSLGVDIARSLASHGYISFLKRTRVGKFKIEDSVTIENLIDSDLNTHLLPVSYGMGNIPVIELSSDQVALLRNGVKIHLKDYSASNLTAQITKEGILQAIVLIENGLCKPIRVFSLT
ncbi:MAG: tRNA pseudouridine(55) synthase TruB [Rickettsiales bacterium]|jgi:tRNA pseudouridine55 synthase|nr:tRNA pseudouridine(55) synthase TruB [Rickettsiales bacterium]